MNALLRLTLILILVAGATGCRGKKCAVSGTVTRDGKPLEWSDEEGHLLVIFFPVNRKSNPDVYRAETDPKTGSFKIDEIRTGKYRVAIQQFDARHNDALEHAFNPGTTTLRYEVTEDGQVIDIDLPAELPRKK